jgi:hypothetical protein
MKKIPYTCPAIDSVISELKQISIESYSYKYYPQDELEYRMAQDLDKINSIANSLLSSMEDIRRANSDLREWAVDAEEERDEKIQEFEKIVQDKNDLIENLEMQIEGFKKELTDYDSYYKLF